VRLIGIRAERLKGAAGSSQQLTIDRQDDNWRLAEQALDKVNGKFGSSMIVPARLLKPPPAGPDGQQPKGPPKQ
jgi:DNA polymerase-4